MSHKTIGTGRIRRIGGRVLFAAVVFAATTFNAAHAESVTNTASLNKMSLEELMNVTVSPFQVSTKYDKGYRAGNTVTGSRLDTSIMDEPFAIQVFTQEFIDDQRPRNIYDIAKYSPGVTYRANDFNEGNANLAIRGFTVSDTPGNVQILRDGFHGPSIFDFTDVERVEIVKGPASFLYGQVAPGGIVNIITKEPQPEFAASARGTYGAYDSYRLEADVTGPILTNGLYFRLAGSFDQDIRYWHPYDAYSWDVAPTLLWQPNDRVSLSLRFENFAKRESPQLMQKPGWPDSTGVVPTAADPNRSGVDVSGLPDTFNSMANTDFRNSDTHQLTAALDVKADDHWDIRPSYSHLQYKVDEAFSGNLGMADSTSYWQGRRFRHVIYGNHDDTFNLEAVGNYDFKGVTLRLLLGGQYVFRKFDNRSGQAPNSPSFPATPPPGSGARPGSALPWWNLQNPGTWNQFNPLSDAFPLLTSGQIDQSTAFEDKAVYGGTTFGFFDDRLLALVGGRLTMTDSRLADHLNSANQPRFDTSKVTPQYGLLYKITPQVALFGTYAESFVPGSQVLNNLDGTTSLAKPTEGSGYDLGLKSDLLDGRVAGTLTFFNVENKNIVNDISQLDPATGIQRSYNVQSGLQRSRGVEVDTTLTLTENWQAYLSYSYMDARIIEFSGHDDAILALGPSAPGYQQVLAFHHAPLQMSAPHLANLWTRYNFPEGWLKGAYIAGGANFVIDQTILSDTPNWAHQTYTLLNAMVGYSWTLKGGTTMSVDLVGKNLGEVHYRPSQSTRGRPREFAVALTVKF